MKENELSDKEKNIYNNLKDQINSDFRKFSGASFKTNDRYKSGMNDFAKFLTKEYKKQKITNVKNAHIEAYVEQLQKSGSSKSNVTTNMSAIRFFYDKKLGGKFNIKSNKELGVIPRNKEDRIGKNKSISNSNYNKLTEKLAHEGKEYVLMGKASRVLGLRISEVFKMRHSKIKEALENDSLEVKGKGGQVRKLPLSKKDKELLKEINAHNDSACDRIFVGDKEKTHKRIKVLQKMIKKVRGTDEFTFHSLRHAYAQELYKELREHGVNDYNARKEVSERLGHHRIDITEVYLN